MERIIGGRPAVVSVTPDTAANSSGPPAPSRPVKAERSAAPDSFASLIGDRAAEAASNDRASAARDQPAPQRRADESAAENRQLRESSSSRARDHVGPADDDTKAARADRGDASTDGGDASKPARSGEAKTGGATSDTKAKDTSDTGSATDQTVSPTIDGAFATSDGCCGRNSGCRRIGRHFSRVFTAGWRADAFGNRRCSPRQLVGDQRIAISARAICQSICRCRDGANWIGYGCR